MARNGVRSEKLQALILSRRNVGEADRLLTLFTREYGLLKVLAKGVRRIPSRRGGHLEPLTSVLVEVTGQGSRRFLAAVEPRDTWPALHQDRVALAHATSMAFAVTNLFAQEEAQALLFDALSQALAGLAALSVEQQELVDISVLQLALNRAGLWPDFTTCQVCGEQSPQRPVVLDVTSGGWRCATCALLPYEQPLTVTQRVLVALQWLSKHPGQVSQLALGGVDQRALLHVLRDYITVLAAVGDISGTSTFAVASS